MPVKPITLENFKTLDLGHPTIIKPDHWADAQNMQRGLDGLWENRRGIKSFTNAIGSGKKAHSIHFWKPSAGSTRNLTVGSGTALYSYAEGTAYNNGTFTSRQTGFTDGQPFEFGQYADVLIATNGVEAMYSTTNNTAWTVRNGADTRIAKYLLFANDTGYVADVASDRSAVYYGGTVPAAPYEFANQVDIESDNGQVLTGITNLGPIIIATKNRSIYTVDIATPKREQLDYGAGCLSHRSIVKAENSVYLASKEGITTLAQRSGTTGSLAATPLSSNIQSLWDRLISTGNINGIYFPKTRSIYWCVTTSEQTYTLVYNVQWQSWSYFVGVNALDWALYEDSDGVERLIYSDASVDKIRELDSVDRDDDGSPINSHLLTGSVNFGTDEIKQCNWVEITGYASTGFEIDYEFYLDESNVASYSGRIDDDNYATTGASSSTSGSLASGSLASGALAGSISSGDDLDVKFWVKRVPLERTFRTIQIKLSNSQTGVRWRFKSLHYNVESTSKDFTPNYIFA